MVKKAKITPHVENRKLALTALFLSVAVIIVGIAFATFACTKLNSIEKRIDQNLAASVLETQRLKFCIDNNVTPCPTDNAQFWTSEEYKSLIKE